MATLVLGVAGAAIGGAVLPAGFSVFGATITGAVIGRAAGTLAGGYIDQALFGATGQIQAQTGPRLDDLKVTASTEGAHIPRLYGRVRLGGQIIWATNLEEQIVKSSGGGGGKGLSSATSSGKEYLYFANFAVGLCEGEIAQIGRVWADGKEIDISDFTYRVYKGTEDQMPDSLIEAKEGVGNVPAYRGLAYIVFERLPLKDFGNRIPQFNFEVFRPVDDFESEVQAITMIPAAGEFVYEPVSEVIRYNNFGFSEPENVNMRSGFTDWSLSLDALQGVLPNVGNVSLFVSWFGNDLRCANCQIQPKVDRTDKNTKPISWAVAGLTRATAPVVSQFDGKPAYGGTPSDATVRDALVDLQNRGLKATLTPFLLMDIPSGNGLSDPWGGAEQDAYPWRGRISVDPAPGQPGTADQTSAAATQINSFYGTVTAADFSVSGGAVTYTGPNEWSYSRFILHYAALAKAAEQISGTPLDAFVIGSEMRALTWARDTTGASFPFVAKLVDLAAEVKTLLPNTKVTYAADWSELTPYQTSQFGGPAGEIFFHLDSLWADGNIDAIGFDNYWPLADWRDGTGHLDWQAGWRSIYDLAYLRSNIEGGEGFDFYYASQSDRDSQTRTQITDGLGKPWVFRFKDIRNWWLNQHYNRPGGVEEASPTAWVPESKPLWIMETGCPAVDKGANQPNVFFDPKSSESTLPYFSNGRRDDLMQRRYLRALIEWYDPAHPDYAGGNPTSTVYGQPMVDTSRIFVYTWDARPYPAFPNNADVWSDAPNWEFGHWLTGRSSDAPVAETVRKLFADYGFVDYSVSGLAGTMSGYVIDRVTSLRDALNPLETAFFFDSVESGGKIVLRPRALAETAADITVDDLVDEDVNKPRFEISRAQETELPNRAKVSFFDGASDYEQATVESLKLTGFSERVASAHLPMVMRRGEAYSLAERLLHEQWSAREKITFRLPPSRLAAEPGDVIRLNTGARTVEARVASITIAEALQAEALAHDPTIYEDLVAPDSAGVPGQGLIYGPPVVAFLDLPLITGSEDQNTGYIAAFASPFGGINVYRSPDTTGYTLNVQLSVPSTMGETEFDFFSGPTSRFDNGNVLRVRIYNPDVTLESVSDLILFGGANLMAVENEDGEWEIFQFQNATLVGTGVYDLSKLLRGRFGTERAMRDPVAAGARVVLLDGSQVAVSMTQNEIGLPFNWKVGPAPQDIGHYSYVDVAHAFTGRALKPYAPVHVRSARTGNDLTISWIRRTRFGGDGWGTADAPLNEDSELYEVDIMEGAAVKRTLSGASPQVVYSEADQIADWGSVQASYTVRIYQLSAVVGRGEPAEATV